MGQEHEKDRRAGAGGRRRRRKFSPEFKRDAVEMVLTSGRSIAEVAAEL